MFPKHKHFSKRSNEFYKIKILTILEFNDECCSLAELNSYSNKELSYISNKLSIQYNNIDDRSNIMYRCLY